MEQIQEMKTGIELIAEERQEQISKHHRTIVHDISHNQIGQLSMAAAALCSFIGNVDNLVPMGWDRAFWKKMANKTYRERLIIAGALIAAEIDRLQNTKPK